MMLKALQLPSVHHNLFSDGRARDAEERKKMRKEGLVDKP